ncbi:hypothetical protein FRC12_020763 [Ceratobasidium sp. 428]|nr:hypothetical protein FRC12_020763 [Ceratobasidium sp. 428]
MHTGFAAGESVMIVKVVGDGREISLDAVKSWMGLERLPAGWMPHGPTDHQGLLEVLGVQRTFNNMLEKAKRGEKID